MVSILDGGTPNVYVPNLINNNNIEISKTIDDITRGVSPRPFYNWDDNDIQMKNFVLKELDLNILYSSGHWETVLDIFTSWYINEEISRANLIPDIKLMLSRTLIDKVYTNFAEYIFKICEQYNWQDEQLELGFFLLNDNRIKAPSGKLTALYTLLKIKKGALAPQLTLGQLSKAKTILAFYDSGCGNCTLQMNKLAELYPNIINQGYEVISVSADSDKGRFEIYAEKLPWTKKYFDENGFAGKDFLNYSVVDTPTFYLLDENNIVQGRYVSIDDIKF